MARIGVVGTGFIARVFARLLSSTHPDLVVSRVLTRRPLGEIAGFPAGTRFTHSIHELIDSSDLVFECSGDVPHATAAIEQAMIAELPVVTMDSEFHVTTGSFFVDKGYLTEAEGDQPGCLAALRENVLQMGFTPLVYGNMKGFLDRNPKPENMAYWAGRQDFSIPMTTSFTDGTKLQVEQALVANGLGATITRDGLEGIESEDTNTGALALARMAESLGMPISDYVLCAKQYPGVFIVCRHAAEHANALRTLKLGDGPHYVIFNPYHLTAFEVVKTIRRALQGGPVLLHNSSRPSISVAAIAKVPLRAGVRIDCGIGSVLVRGEAVKASRHPEHVPIGVLTDAVLKRNIEPGEMVNYDAVDLTPSRALEIAEALFRGRQTDAPASARVEPALSCIV